MRYGNAQFLCFLFFAFLVSLAHAQESGASEEISGVWQIVEHGPGKTAFAMPVRTSDEMCYVRAISGLPKDWEGVDVPETAYLQTYFALVSGSCTEVEIGSYKALAAPIEEATLVRLIRGIDQIASNLTGEVLREFERYFEVGIERKSRLNYETLLTVGVSEFDPRSGGSPKFEMYFRGHHGAFILLVESYAQGFRAVETAIIMD